MNITIDSRVYGLRDREIRDNIPLITVVVVFLFLGVVGNCYALAFFGFKQHRSVTDFLISVLAGADLLACLVYYDEIFVVVDTFTLTNLPGCKVLFVVNNWVTLTSVSLLAVIAVDRHRRICKPLKAQLSPRSAKIVVAAVITTTFLLCIREAFLAEIVTKSIAMNDNSTVNGYVCTHTAEKSKQGFRKASLIILAATFVLLFAVIIGCYILIARQIRVVSLKFKNKDKDIKMKENPKFVFEKKNEHSVGYLVADESTKSNESTDVTVVDAETNKKQQQGEDKDKADALPENDIDLGASDATAILSTDGADVEANHNSKDDDSDIHENVQKRGKTSSKNEKSSVSGSQSDRKAFQAEKRVTKMVVAFTAVSLLSFVPYFVANLALPRTVSTEKQLHNMSKKIARQFYILNSIANPYVICFFHPKFRQFIRSCCVRLACCGRRRDEVKF